VLLQPAGERPAFFCVHPAGGHVFCYVELARRLGAERPFYGFESRAFGTSPRTVGAMATDYVEALLERQAAGPYLLGGWSMGGVVAFEMARQLSARGREVALLALLDSRIPTAAQRLETEDEVALIASFAADLGVSLRRLGLSWRNVRALGEDERLAFVLEEAKAAGAVPREVMPADIRTLFAGFRENARAMCAYAPRPLDVRVTLLRAEESSPAAGDDEAMGWEEWARGGVEVLRVPGSHSTMTREPHVRLLAERLRECLRRAG
jgi:thioesterase domain-containing protein